MKNRAKNKKSEKIKCYEDVQRRYQALSNRNTMRARRIGTKEAYEKAQSREKLIWRACLSDCERYDVFGVLGALP